MAVVIVAVALSATANSYVTVAEAQAYFDGRVGASAWSGATADEQMQALVTATSRIDQEKFVGVKASTAQRLKWPRTLAKDDDGLILDSATVPRAVKEATYELALYVLANKTTDVFAPTGLEGYAAIKAGPVDITLNTKLEGVDKSLLPPQVKRLLDGLIWTYGAVNVNIPSTYVRLSRG